MKSDEIQRLLSEHAAGTISEQDLQLLMREALENQEVFDAAFLDRPLAEIMGDYSAREELRVALELEKRPGFFSHLWRPWPLAAVTTTAVALFAVLVSRHVYTPTQSLTPRESVSVTAEAPAPNPAAVPATPSPASDELADKKEGRAVPAAERDKKSALPVQPSSASAVLRSPSEEVRSEAKETATVEARADRDLAEPPRAPIPPTPVEKPAVVARAKEVEGTGVRVAGGAAGGVVGGVVGGLAPPPARQTARNEAIAARAAAEAAPQESRFALDESRAVRGGPSAPSVRVLRQTAGGSYEAVPPDTIFRAGDTFKLEVGPRPGGFLRVAEQFADGSWTQLFPPGGSGGTRFDGAAPVRIPEEGAWDVGPAGADRRIYVIATSAAQAGPIPAGALTGQAQAGATEIRIHVSPSPE